MPIPYFNLHDMTAEKLAEEMIRQIPAHTPEWRNPAPGDPGRSLIDLFAWMGDKLLYRVNLLPERQRLMFLRLLDMPLRPALPARGVVQLSHANPRDLAPVDLAARSLLPGPVEFETTGEATLLPLTGAVFVKRRPDSEEAAALAGVTEDLASVYGLDQTAPYVATPLFSAGRAEADGVDLATDTIDQTLWIALLAPEAPADKAEFRRQLLGREGAAPLVLNIGFAPQTAAPVEGQAADAPAIAAENWLWQMPAPQQSATGDAPDYTSLAPAISDGTDGFTRPGVLRLTLPDARNIGLPENDPDLDVLAGVGERPPRLDDADLADRLVTWLRLRPKARAETFALSWLGINAVEVEARRSLQNLVLGSASGGSDQSVQLPVTSVDADSLEIEVQREDGLYEPWSQVDSLLGQDREAPVYRLDAEAGLLRFGNGVSGRVPPVGAKIRAKTLRHGGGRAGNLAAGSLTAISQSRLKAMQPLALTGGEEAETLAQAEARLPAMLRHNDRAVTEQDFQDLAAATPGLDLARVEVLPRFRPFQRQSDIPGAVSVMVLPSPAARATAAPRPDRPMLEAVYAHLDRRRLVGTELHVIGPDYVQIGVSVALEVRAGFAPDKILPAVETALRDYLSPIAPGGRACTGWELGQSVSNLDLDVQVSRVEGVGAVYGLSLFRIINGAWRMAETAPGGLLRTDLEAWQLPELAKLDLRLGATAPAGSASEFGHAGGVDSSLTPTATPIPVVPEIC